MEIMAPHFLSTHILRLQYSYKKDMVSHSTFFVKCAMGRAILQKLYVKSTNFFYNSNLHLMFKTINSILKSNRYQNQITFAFRVLTSPFCINEERSGY